EATVRRWVVRRRYNNGVGEVLFAITVINKDSSRDNRRRSDTVISLDDGLHVISGQHFQCGALSRAGHSVRVLSHVKRAIVAPAAPVITNRLSNRQNVCCGE